MAELFAQVRDQSVISGIIVPKSRRDSAEVGIDALNGSGFRELHVSVWSRGDEAEGYLVDVFDAARQMIGPGAYVARGQHDVRGELALHGSIPLHAVGPRRILFNVGFPLGTDL